MSKKDQAQKTMEEERQRAAVEVAHEMGEQGEEGIRILSTGYRVRLKAVPIGLLNEVQLRISDPPVPMWHNPDKDREEENPSDPEYVRVCEELELQRAIATLDATILFGVDLVDGVPPKEEWLPKLQFLHKLGHIDLDPYNFDDPLECEFLFKKFIVVSRADVRKITSISSGVQEALIQRMEDSFRG